MNNLINIQNKNGKLVVTSRQIAKDFEKDHSKVTRDIEKLIEGIAKNGDTYNNLFIESMYKNEQNKQLYKEYLLTRDGFSLLVMGFTGYKALEWKLKYIEAFNKMEDNLNKSRQLTPIEQLRLQYEVIEQHEEKLNTIESKVYKLENNMVIEHGQEVTIKKTVDTRINKVLGQVYWNKKIRAKTYRALWKDYKDYFNITSYHDTLKKDLQIAIKLITEWNPNGGLLREIEQTNKQLYFKG